MLTHNDLINLGVLLGYKDLEDGLCNGFNCMWLQAYFCKQLPVFYKRLRLIDKYKNQFPLLVEQIKAAQESKTKDPVNQELLDILAFFEGMTLYLKPDGYRFLFPNRPTLNQEDIDVIFQLMKPVFLDNQELHLCFNHEYVLTEEAFIKLFSAIAYIFKSSSEPMALLVSCNHHTASLCFNEKTAKWFYMDVNSLNQSEDESYHWEIDTQQLIQVLQASFTTTVYLSFNIKIFSTRLDHQIKQQLQSLVDFAPIGRIGTTDSNGVGLLYLACQNGNTNHVRQLLAQGYRLELNHQDKNGFSPFLITCMYGYSDILSLLLDSSLPQNINAAISDGSTALHLACANGHTRIVQELLKYPELNINQTNLRGTTPFYFACQNGYDEIVTLLLGQKQLHTIDTQGQEGYTPLMVACLSPHTRNNKKLFALLLLHSASMTLKNNANQTALDIAVSTNNPAAIDTLSLWLLHHPQQLSEFMSPITFTTIDKKYLHRSRIKQLSLTFFNKHDMVIELEPLNRCSLKV